MVDAATLVTPTAHGPIAVWDADTAVFVAVLPSGPIRVLQGTAAVIWRALSDGAPETTAERVAARTGAEVADIRADVDSFVQELRAAGVLPPSGGAG